MEHMTAAEHEMIKNMTNHDPNEIMNKMTENIYWFIGVALISWTCGYIQMATLMTSAQRFGFLFSLKIFNTKFLTQKTS